MSFHDALHDAASGGSRALPGEQLPDVPSLRLERTPADVGAGIEEPAGLGTLASATWHALGGLRSGAVAKHREGPAADGDRPALGLHMEHRRAHLLLLHALLRLSPHLEALRGHAGLGRLRLPLRPMGPPADVQALLLHHASPGCDCDLCLGDPVGCGGGGLGPLGGIRRLARGLPHAGGRRCMVDPLRLPCQSHRLGSVLLAAEALSYPRARRRRGEDSRGDSGRVALHVVQHESSLRLEVPLLP
mmetsp:Transcript_32637/g.71298  ORF Transcript_32637/g.71298 Transcript_32637/m.71298 type:complete len:246 (-) Transcript_32637:202-939(-)